MLEVKGRILSYIGGLAIIELPDKNEIKLKPKGIFRHSKMELKPMVGDFVLLEKQDQDYIMKEIFPRKNNLIRPKVANVDEIIIIQSVIQPDLNFDLLNKYLAFYENYVNNVKIGFTKIDLLSDSALKQFLEVKNIYDNDGYQTFNLNQETDFLNLVDDLSKKAVCLIGNSGVGKSSLINRIDPNLFLKTREISKALNRGKHTTTNVVLIPYKDGHLIDTPGFASLEIDFNAEFLAQAWHDFYKLHTKCKFSNCLHIKEKNCAILSAVNQKEINLSRYESYLKLLEKLKNRK